MNLRRSVGDAGHGLFATDLGAAAARSVLSERAFHRMISLREKGPSGRTNRSC